MTSYRSLAQGTKMAIDFVCSVADAGGTHLRLALVDSAGMIHQIRRKKIRSFCEGLSSDEVGRFLVSDIAGYHRDFSNLLPPAAPHVVAFPGPVAEGRRVLAAPTLMGRTGMLPNLHAMLEAELQRPVWMLNDVSAAAWCMSMVFDDDRILVVTVSSGIGSKIFDRKHSLGVLDDPPFAGEIGHQVVDYRSDAPWCDCGQGRGHLCAVSSGRGAQQAARQQARADPLTFAASACVREYHGTADTLTNEQHLVPAARAGDAWAVGVIRRGARYLAAALLLSVISIGIQRVVVIGGFASALGQVYLDILREEMQQVACVGPLAPDLVNSVVLGLDDEPCLRGAAVYGARLASRT
jgi:glucokinase